CSSSRAGRSPENKPSPAGGRGGAGRPGVGEGGGGARGGYEPRAARRSPPPPLPPRGRGLFTSAFGAYRQYNRFTDAILTITHASRMDNILAHSAVILDGG